MKQIHRRTTMQKRDLNKATFQLYWFHTHAQIRPPKISSISVEHHAPVEHLWKTASAYQKNFKRLKKTYKKFLFAVVKRINPKNEEINK